MALTCTNGSWGRAADARKTTNNDASASTRPPSSCCASTCSPATSATPTCSSPQPRGRRCHGNNFRTKYRAPAVKAAKVDQNVTLHNLRAAHASWLLAGGADIIVVQERFGHRRITTTQQYTGTLPDAGERALAAFRRIRYGDDPSTE
jgi:hypothetical protein